MSDQNTTNQPFEILQDGEAVIKLWKHESRNGEVFVHVSVGHMSKDDRADHWESSPFAADTLGKLQSLIPRALEMAHVHEYAFNAQRLEKARESQAQAERQKPVKDMAAERDGALAKAASPEPQHDNHHRGPNRPRSR